MIQRFTTNSEHRSGSAAGFTLIELLVVIAIIGVLASVVLASLTTARDKARDARRLADMDSLRNAFELFYLENNRYPGPTDGVPVTGQMIGVGNEIDTALSPFISNVPRDPAHDAGDGELPVGGSVYFYGYDPQHILKVYDSSGNEICSDNPNSIGATFTTGIVFGFNRAEGGGTFNKDTCSGSNVNLNNADYNQGTSPPGT